MSKPEEWRAVPGYQGYDVSDFGNIRSYRRRGRGNKLKSRPVVLSPCTNHRGYKTTCLRSGGERPRRHGLHQLVMLAFVGPCPSGQEVCHRDGNPGNNRLSNLRYDTHRANMQEAAAHGTICRGVNKSTTKLTESQVFEAVRLRETGAAFEKIGETLGVSREAARLIVIGRTWKHLDIPGRKIAAKPAA